MLLRLLRTSLVLAFALYFVTASAKVVRPRWSLVEDDTSLALYAPLNELGYAFPNQKSRKAQWKGEGFIGQGCVGGEGRRCAADRDNHELQSTPWKLNKGGRDLLMMDAFPFEGLVHNGSFTVSAWIRMTMQPVDLQTENIPILLVSCGGHLLLSVVMEAGPPPGGMWEHKCILGEGASHPRAPGLPDIGVKQWWHVSCVVAGSLPQGSPEWDYTTESFFAHHDDIRGVNDITWAQQPWDVVEADATHFGKVPAAWWGKSCDVQVGARNSGIAVQYIHMASRTLTKKELYDVAASTPFGRD